MTNVELEKENIKRYFNYQCRICGKIDHAGKSLKCVYLHGKSDFGFSYTILCPGCETYFKEGQAHPADLRNIGIDYDQYKRIIKNNANAESRSSGSSSKKSSGKPLSLEERYRKAEQERDEYEREYYDNVHKTEQKLMRDMWGNMWR